MPNSITILVFAMNLQGYWVVISSLLPALEAATTSFSPRDNTGLKLENRDHRGIDYKSKIDRTSIVYLYSTHQGKR